MSSCTHAQADQNDSIELGARPTPSWSLRDPLELSNVGTGSLSSLCAEYGLEKTTLDPYGRDLHCWRMRSNTCGIRNGRVCSPASSSSCLQRSGSPYEQPDSNPGALSLRHRFSATSRGKLRY